MLEEKRYIGKHKIVMDKRQRLSVTGLIDVISFDEESIITDTDLGILVIRGQLLHINALNLEKGELDIDGEIESLNYEDRDTIKNKGLLRKIFK